MKKLICILCAIAVLLSLTACGGKKQPDMSMMNQQESSGGSQAADAAPESSRSVIREGEVSGGASYVLYSNGELVFTGGDVKENLKNLDVVSSYVGSVTSLKLEDGVSELGDGVFSDFTALTRVVVGDSVTVIGRNAFSG